MSATMVIVLLISSCMCLCTSAASLAEQHHGEHLYHIGKDTTPSEDSVEPVVRDCGTIMASSGLNYSSFWHGAAHGLHSLHLEEIREYFEPDAPVNNKIPVVNKNLSSNQVILFDAPLAGYDDDFKTMAMKVMAFFMLNDRPDFFEQAINTLEKVTHQYHMHEIYAAASPLYKQLKENPPPDPELCPCVNDVTGNGILTEMANIARQLKYYQTPRMPRAMGSNNSYNDWGPDGCGCSNSYNRYNSYRKGCRCPKMRARRSTVDDVTPEMIDQYEQEYLNNSTAENAYRLLDITPWTPNTLTGPEQWIRYEAMLTTSMLDDKELNDFVVFMYCKLNHPEMDYPKDLFE